MQRRQKKLARIWLVRRRKPSRETKYRRGKCATRPSECFRVAHPGTPHLSKLALLCSESTAACSRSYSSISGTARKRAVVEIIQILFRALSQTALACRQRARQRYYLSIQADSNARARPQASHQPDDFLLLPTAHRARCSAELESRSLQARQAQGDPMALSWAAKPPIVHFVNGKSKNHRALAHIMLLRELNLWTS